MVGTNTVSCQRDEENGPENAAAAKISSTTFALHFLQKYEDCLLAQLIHEDLCGHHKLA